MISNYRSKMSSVNKWYGNQSILFSPLDDDVVDALREKIRKAIASSLMPTYVYTYPPRQTYRVLPQVNNDKYIKDEITKTPKNFNLYLHIPFCKQICHYCNLFTVVGQEALINEYNQALLTEMQHYARFLGEQTIRTVYFGGGTPSLLSNKNLEELFLQIEKNFPRFNSSCDEVCIEVAPDTIDKKRAIFFKNLGFNRINLGVQSFCDQEIKGIGRGYSSDVCRKAVESIREADIGNLCVDLINGLLDQTRDAWERSIIELVAMKPETICLYPLTVRPATGFYSHADALQDFQEIYIRYEIGKQILIENGYEQETHIRFIIPGKGGYKQKEYHWEGATVLGIGAGARTYAPGIHFRNGYSSRSRNTIFNNYLQSIKAQGHSRIDGFILNEEEQIRREFVLNLHRLTYDNFNKTYNQNFHNCFPSQITALEKEGLIILEPERITFSQQGLKYRDLISRMFFSETVIDLEEEYSYSD